MSFDYSLTCRSASAVSYVPVADARRAGVHARVVMDDHDWAAEAQKAKLAMRELLRTELREARDEAVALGDPALSETAEAVCLRIADAVIAAAIWKPFLVVSASATNDGGSILLIERRSHRRRVTITISRDGQSGVVMRIEGDGRPLRDTFLQDAAPVDELLSWICRP